MRLGGPQNRSGRGDEEKEFLPLPGFEPYNSDGPARSLVIILTIIIIIIIIIIKVK
jgi:hypothetical protein